MGESKKIAFATGQASGYDELAGAFPAYVNALPEGDGFRARPGVTPLVDVLAQGQSFYAAGAVESIAVVETPKYGKRLVFTTADRRIFYIDENGFVRDTSAGIQSLILGTVKTKLYTIGSICLAVGGGQVQMLDSGGASVPLAGTGDYVHWLTDVCSNSGHIIGIRADTDEFYWSGPIPGDITDWGELEFATAQARPDINVAIRDTANEVWIWGTQTLQIFQPDTNVRFAPAAASDVGCAARDSVIRVENQFAWLDDRMRIQLSNGREVTDDTDISKPIRASLDSLSYVKDCWAFRARMGAHDMLVWSFPTVGRAFCFDMTSKAWCEMRRWADGRWQGFAPTAYCWWAERRKHIVGLADGTLAELSFNAQSDLGDTLRWVVRTGFEDYGSNFYKNSDEIYLRVRGATDVNPEIEVKWRDTLGAFCHPIKIQGQRTDLTETRLSVMPVGEPYVSRQYEFTGRASMVPYVAGAIEDISIPEAA